MAPRGSRTPRSGARCASSLELDLEAARPPLGLRPTLPRRGLPPDHLRGGVHRGDAAVRKIKTTEGTYIWQPSLIVGPLDTILGKPVLVDPNIADIAVAAESVLFGDFSAYYVRLAGGIAFERSDHFAFGADTITFRARMRADDFLVD